MKAKKNTKYFLNLEKRHSNQGAISQLKLENENFVTTDREILSECGSFYKNFTALTMALKMNELIRCFLKHKWIKNKTRQNRIVARRY